MVMVIIKVLKREINKKHIYILVKLKGVQEAFEFSDKIMTLSLHRYSPGFYPGMELFSFFFSFKIASYLFKVRVVLMKLVKVRANTIQ